MQAGNTVRRKTNFAVAGLAVIEGVTCGAQNCNATSSDISVNSQLVSSDAVDCDALLTAAARQAARD